MMKPDSILSQEKQKSLERKHNIDKRIQSLKGISSWQLNRKDINFRMSFRSGGFSVTFFTNQKTMDFSDRDLDDLEFMLDFMEKRKEVEGLEKSMEEVVDMLYDIEEEEMTDIYD